MHQGQENGTPQFEGVGIYKAVTPGTWTRCKYSIEAENAWSGAGSALFRVEFNANSEVDSLTDKYR